MMRQVSTFLRLRWLLVLLFSLTWVTIGKATTLAERSDFWQSSNAAKTEVEMQRISGPTIV